MSVIKGEGKHPILFNTKSVVAGPVTHEAYLSRPDLAGEWPTVLIVPDGWGVTSSVKDVARRLARHGVAAIVADPYRGSPPARGAAPEDAAGAFAALPERQVRRDIDDLVRYIGNPAGFWSSAEHGFAVLGIGAGGATAARVAAGSGAALILVSSTADVGALADVAGPVLGIAGKDDEATPADAVAEARRAAPHAEWVLYEGIGSGFFDDARDGFDWNAFNDAIERIIGFCGKHLPPAP